MIFVVSLLVALIIITTKKFHAKYTADEIIGAQKFHSKITPRIGGVGIFLALTAGYLIMPNLNITKLIICLLPVFTAGLVEDISKNVSPFNRLIAAFVSSLMLFIIFDISIDVGAEKIQILDQNKYIIWIVGVVFLAGMINAINIIDGFNGLASGVVLIQFSTINYLLNNSENVFLVKTIEIMILAIMGFFVLNFPKGKIFLGDAGAYMLGFMIAAISILSISDNKSQQIIPLIINICYPVYEVMFSIIRKTLREGYHPSKPDGVHLHMLFYKRYFRKLKIKPEYKNSLTSLIFWVYQAFCSLIAISSENKSIGFQFFMLIICGLIYHLVYVRMSKFKWKLA